MDKGHNYADKILAQIADEMLKVFDEIESKVIEKLKRYLKRFEKEIKEHEQMVDDGEMTEKEFEQWFIGKVTTGKEWNKIRDELTDDLTDAMSDALKLTGLGLNTVYLYNLAFAERSISSQVSKWLNRRVTFNKTPKRRLLPKSPDPVKNRFWHRRKIESVIRKGMKKGQSVDKIAKQLNKVIGMDRTSAYRAARTAITNAENVARLDAMREADEFYGIKYDKVWIATLDDRTRTSHRVINGERIPYDQEFSNGLMFPADDSGDPEEVYNCRCTLGWAIAGIDADIPEGPDGMGKLEWSAKKPISKPYPRW